MNCIRFANAWIMSGIMSKFNSDNSNIANIKTQQQKAMTDYKRIFKI